MTNLFKYYYEKAKHHGVEITPLEELMNLGFRGIRQVDMYLPEYMIYETSNEVINLPNYIEKISHLKKDKKVA